MNKELEKVKELYELRRSRAWPPRPKQGIFIWRCPQCNCKLKRESFKAPLYAETGGEEFADRVIAEHWQPPGLYHITLDHFTCSCGYEYIGETLAQVEM
jgi:hypothetical protein